MSEIIQSPQQLNIELSEEIAQGIYSNLAVITHSSSEFVVDFIRIMPGIPKANVKSRIILTPEHAKRLLLALQDNLKKFESVHGSIKISSGGDPLIPPMTFGGPTAQA
jgi:predicted transcriptional regulator